MNGYLMNNRWQDPSERPVASDNLALGLMLARRLVAGKWFLLQVWLCGTLLSVVAAFLIPKRYEATAMMAPPSGQSSLMNMMSSLGSAGQLGISMLHTTGGYYAKLATTEGVENRLIDRFDLRTTYGAKLYENARHKLEARTAIIEDTKSGVISIRVTDRTAWRAAALANGYIEELNRTLTQMDTSAAHRERAFLEERLKQVGQELDTASSELAQYSSATATLDVKAQGMGLVESGTKLKADLIAGQSELEGLEQIYSADNVRVRTARARVSVLSRNLRQLEDGPDAAQSQPPNMRQLPLRAVRYAELLRHVEIEEKVYAELTKQYELAKVDEVKELPVVQIVSLAHPPEKRSFPHRPQVVLVGMFFSLLLGAAWILWIELWSGVGASHPRMQSVRVALAALRRSEEAVGARQK